MYLLYINIGLTFSVGDEPLDQIDLEDGMNDVDLNGGSYAEHIDDVGAPENVRGLEAHVCND